MFKNTADVDLFGNATNQKVEIDRDALAAVIGETLSSMTLVERR